LSINEVHAVFLEVLVAFDLVKLKIKHGIKNIP
jgi:hypothetical protein